MRAALLLLLLLLLGRGWTVSGGGGVRGWGVGFRKVRGAMMGSTEQN